MANPSRATSEPKKNRDDRVELRLEEAEKQAFREAARLSGLPLSAWIRERLRRAAREELVGLGRPIPFLLDIEKQDRALDVYQARIHSNL
jgi:uncharacterized protein (DUF1778 family)